VLVCHNGQDALRQVQQEPDIALVLLDMMLPDINGLQVLLQLQQRPALPVMMLTGLGSESDVVVGLEMGADDYIGKPFNPRVVVARVKAVAPHGRAGGRSPQRPSRALRLTAGRLIPPAVS
jgi:DNA-binding response OmpR family regulator